MNISVSDLRISIIRPCLHTLGHYSQDAENLLAGTATYESSALSLNQFANCPQPHKPPAPNQPQSARSFSRPAENCAALTRRGLGIFRITPEKHREIWDTYLIQFPDLASNVRGFASQKQFFNDPHGELISNLNYATVIAWMIYCSAGVLTKANALCDATQPFNVDGLAQLWSLHFDNGTGCARNADEFIATYACSTSETGCKKLVA